MTAPKPDLLDAIKALLPSCYITRNEVMPCSDLIGIPFGNGVWLEAMCCLPCRIRTLLAGATTSETVGGATHEEWGIERSLPQVNNGAPYIEWRGWQGHDGYRVDYTAESVFSLASGRPVFRRLRTRYPDTLTEPERVPAPVPIEGGEQPKTLIFCDAGELWEAHDGACCSGCTPGVSS